MKKINSGKEEESVDLEHFCISSLKTLLCNNKNITKLTKQGSGVGKPLSEHA